METSANTRILTVDDSAAMRQMISLTLSSAGFSVAQAADGGEALAMAQAESFRLMLVDLHMPGLDGLSLVRALRSLPAYRTTPLLMLTTATSQQQQRDARAAGATGWLQKPFLPDQLIGTVRRILG